MSTASDDLPDEPSSRVLAGRYRLGERLGEGTFAEVYAAEDLLGGGAVALKLFPRGTPLPALRRERAALRRLRLPGVVALLDSGEDRDQPFLVMEKVEGKPFPGVSIPAPWSAVAAPLVALLEVLGAVHAAGAMHLDLKPAHVLVDGEGGVALLDLGLSRGEAIERHPAGASGGTPRYAAPEQLLAEQADPRTDLYAVGLLVYEALCGALPQDNLPPEARAAARVRRDAPPLRVPGLPERVAAWVDRLLARSLDERPASAEEALSLLGPPDRPWLDALCPADGPPLHQDDCAALFCGPTHFLHLPERAAEELWRRTGGQRAAIRHELGVWKSLGLARLFGSKLLVGREDLARLRQPAWSRILGPPAGARPSVTAAELLSRAQLSFREGELAEGELYLGVALELASENDLLEQDILSFWLRMALSDGTPETLNRLCAELDRFPSPQEPIDSLARAALAAACNEGARALELLDRLPEAPTSRLARSEFSRALLGVCRLMVLLHAAVNVGEEAQNRALTRARRLCEGREDPELDQPLLVGEARLHYTRGDYRRAALLHEQAIEASTTTSSRIAALNHAAVCWLEVPDLGLCAERAEQARQLALSHHLPVHECRATHTLRAAAWRAGRALPPEPELVDAAAALGVPLFEGLHALGEAAFAWRFGQDALALRLAGCAERAFKLLKSRGGVLLARALWSLLARDSARELIQETLASPLPDIDWQVLGLLAASLEPEERGRALALSRAAPNSWLRRELLSPQESVEALITTAGDAAT